MEKEKLLEILGADFDNEKLEALEGFINKSSQSNEDRIRGDYSKKNKALEEKLRAKELESMTELEKKEALFNEAQSNWEAQKKEWEKDRLVKEKTDFFKEKGAALDVFDLVRGSNVEEWEKSLDSINGIINKVAGSKLKEESGRFDIGGNKEPKKIDQNKVASDAFDNKF